jgi:hypothetical protein
MAPSHGVLQAGMTVQIMAGAAHLAQSHGLLRAGVTVQNMAGAAHMAQSHGPLQAGVAVQTMAGAAHMAQSHGLLPPWVLDSPLPQPPDNLGASGMLICAAYPDPRCRVRCAVPWHP